MPEATSETNKATQNDQQQGQQQEQAQQQGGQQPVSFDLPEDSTQTALNKNDRTTVVDLQTGKEVPEPVARSQHAENLILCCLDPSKKPDRYDAAVRVAKAVVKPGDKIIFMTVLPLQILGDAGIAAYGTSYDINYQVETLHHMRDKAVASFTKLAKEFPEGVQAYARIVHGGAARQILNAAVETNCSLVILGKRKMGMWHKLVSPSVSSWVVSKAPCDVLVAK